MLKDGWSCEGVKKGSVRLYGVVRWEGDRNTRFQASL